MAEEFYIKFLMPTHGLKYLPLILLIAALGI